MPLEPRHNLLVDLALAALRDRPPGERLVELGRVARELGQFVAMGPPTGLAHEVAEAELAAIVREAWGWEAELAAEASALAATGLGHGAELAGGTAPDMWLQAEAPIALDVGDGDLAKQAGIAWRALLLRNHPPRLFRYGDQPVRLERDDAGGPRLVPLEIDRMAEVLARIAECTRPAEGKGRRKRRVRVDAPLRLVRHMLAMPDPPLPVLRGISTAPTIGRDGAVRLAPGFDPQTGLLHAPPVGFKPPALATFPGEADIRRARELLTGELLGDFPFVGEAELAHALGFLLLPLVRPLIDGPTPMHLVEKPTPGTGATLLLEVLAFVATGFSPGMMTEADREDEWRKRITAELRGGAQVIVVDNLRRKLDSPALASAITVRVWHDRVLGLSEVVKVPVRCVWAATGNNPTLSTELARRTVRIRLDAGQPTPWRGRAFKHPSLRAFAAAERGKLVGAALTLARVWALDRDDDHAGPALGMFEAWSGVIGGILERAGVPGFLGNVDEFHAAGDTELTAWSEFLRQWWLEKSDHPVGVSDLYFLALKADPPLELGDAGDHGRKSRLGRMLVAKRDRPVLLDLEGGSRYRLCVRQAGDGRDSARGTKLWRLVAMDA